MRCFVSTKFPTKIVNCKWSFWSFSISRDRKKLLFVCFVRIIQTSKNAMHCKSAKLLQRKLYNINIML